MKTTNLQIRVPQSLRNEATAVLDSVGLDMSTAIRIYLKKIVNTKSIPFSLVAEDSPSLEYVPVDAEIQSKLNEVDSLWEKQKKNPLTIKHTNKR